jgi:hypothetical protein
MKKVLKWVLGILLVTEALHVGEWFLEGKKVAEEAKVPKKKALLKCLTLGILWWKPLKKQLKG